MNDLEQRLAHLSPERRELLRRAARQDRAARGRIRPQPRPERIPLTFGQRRLWLLDQFAPGLVAYNSPLGKWLHGELDVDAMRAAIQTLVDRHEVLRTVYPAPGGQPYQRILPRCELPWRSAIANGDGVDARRADALRIAREEVVRPFALATEPPIRAVLIRVSDDLHLLTIVFHHIAIDGWSISTMEREFVAAYNRLREGATLDNAAPELQIADVALWQQQTFGGEGLQQQLDFWSRHLADAPAVLDLPTDRARPAMQSFEGGICSAQIPAALYERLQTFARDQQVTLSILVFAVFQVLLSRYSGQDRVVAAMGVAGRARLELEPVVGFFINMLPLQADVSDDPEFLTFLSRMRGIVLEAMENADTPLDRILETLRLPRSTSYTPFAQVMYFFQSYPEHALAMSGLRLDDVHISELRPPTAQGDLSLFVNQYGPGDLMFEYSTELYDEATIVRMAGHLVTLLGAIVAAPRTALSRLPMLSEDEIEQLARWNDTRRALPENPTIAALIAERTARAPDAVAVVFAGRELSYRELDRRANMVAHALRAEGVEPGMLVGLYVDRSLEMIIGLLGILKAGGAYVPLDPSYPVDRLAYMVELSASRVIVTQPALRDTLPSPVPSVVVVDADSPLDASADAPPSGGAGPEDPAYVIFTSGSTGKPKGVEIRQRSAVNLIRSIAREPGLTDADTICAISTLSFDIALTELVVPLTVGARILLVDRDTVRDGLRLRKLVDTAPLTIMQATPATWRMLLDVGWGGRRDMRIISTGEALPRELADRLMPMARELWNLYGPTETTVYSALCRVQPGEGPIIVGRPVDNTRIHIVDRHMQLQPVGVPGELLIGGDGLASGYRARPDLTAEKFIPDPFAADPQARLYRTGDLAFWRTDGTVQVIGRIDHQVKLRGFRIELGEIETVLAQYPGMTQVVVHCREDRPGDQRLVAYFTQDGIRASDAELRTHLKLALPDYMVPSAFVGLDGFPLTPNGKVDRRALPAPEAAAGASDDLIAPRTPEEEALAALWGELLNLPAVDVRANFFDLGGHSVLGTQMLSRIEYEYGIELSLRVLFEAPTLEQMAARVVEACAIADQSDMDALLRKLEHLSDEEISQQLVGGQKERSDV
ncbi:MAG: amino acid adenylation domain-containing protein [Lysobacter sp.]|nr:amino acid adenylation domain-containing protein [Lysobacter sp.]